MKQLSWLTIIHKAILPKWHCLWQSRLSIHLSSHIQIYFDISAPAKLILFLNDWCLYYKLSTEICSEKFNSLNFSHTTFRIMTGQWFPVDWWLTEMKSLGSQMKSMVSWDFIQYYNLFLLNTSILALSCLVVITVKKLAPN